MSIRSLSRTYPHGQLPPIRSPDELSLLPSVMNGCRKGINWFTGVIENLDLVYYEQELSRHRFGVLPPGAAVGLRFMVTRPACSPACWNKRNLDDLRGTCFIAANDHPDHDTIANAVPAAVPQGDRGAVRQSAAAGEMGVLKMGTLAR